MRPSELLGGPSQPIDAGAAAFEGLGVNSTGVNWRLAFVLNSSTAGAFGAASEPFDCHGAPAALRMLPGWPPLLEVVDADGLRATAVRGVELRSFLEFPDGGLEQVYVDAHEVNEVLP